MHLVGLCIERDGRLGRGEGHELAELHPEGGRDG